MKKRIYFLIASLLLSLAGMQTAMAQQVKINFVGNEAVEYDVSQIESIEFEEGHEYVDLGLPSGTLWATCNVGASKPEEAGDYFAWGETQPKDTYNWETYQLCDGSYNTLTKYCTNENYGTVDNKTELEPEDDAAAVNWGEKWQMPTREQILELVNSNNTTTTWTTQNGVDGRLITSNVNGNSIFLPATGSYSESSLQNAGTACYYWSRSLDVESNNLGFELYYSSDYRLTTGERRYYGRAVRPVRVKEVVEHGYVDLGLPSGTLWASSNVGADNMECGDYFAWGETEPKSDYTWENYKWCMGTTRSLTKYCNRSDIGYNGFTDNLMELLPEDDAATVNWGEEWQTPSDEQWEELLNSGNTILKTMKINRRTYFIIISKINGNSIFLPAAGHYSNTGSIDTGKSKTTGFYWSRSLYGSSNSAYYRRFVDSDGVYSVKVISRHTGMSVRPVRKQ